MSKAQPALPDVDSPEIFELSEAQADYKQAARNFAKASAVKEELKAKLIALMKQHGLEVYRDEDFLSILKPGKENVQVKAVDEDPAGDDDSDTGSGESQ